MNKKRGWIKRRILTYAITSAEGPSLAGPISDRVVKPEALRYKIFINQFEWEFVKDLPSTKTCHMKLGPWKKASLLGLLDAIFEVTWTATTLMMSTESRLFKLLSHGVTTMLCLNQLHVGPCSIYSLVYQGPRCLNYWKCKRLTYSRYSSWS